MAITLDQFRAIANGSHNVGQIMLSGDGNGLQKINNHVWKTGKNNVLTSAEDNRKVRQALYEAFKNDGTISFERLTDVEDILLGGGNANRSLSRDFVKKLFDVVGHAQRGDSIVDMMNRVGKSLSERKVSVPAATLVTSSKTAAYTLYASEKIDAIAGKGQEGYGEFIQGFDRDARSPRACFTLGLGTMANCLAEMVKFDSRIAGRPDKDAFSTRLNQVVSNLINRAVAIVSNNPPDGAKDFFIQLAKRQFEQVYAEFGIQDVAQDHLVRIFPSDDGVRPTSDCFNVNQAAMLKDLFTKLALNRNFDGLETLPLGNDDDSVLIEDPAGLYSKIADVVNNSKTIQDLSGLFKLKFIEKLGALRQGRENSNWLSDHIGRSTLLSTARDDIFDDLGKAFDYALDSLSDSDADMLVQKFGCERKDVLVKLTRYVKDELDKLGANLGQLSQYAE